MKLTCMTRTTCPRATEIIVVSVAAKSKSEKWNLPQAAAAAMTPGGNCLIIGLPGKSILRDYFQEKWTSRRPFLLLRIHFPGRPIFIQFIPAEEEPLLAVDDTVEREPPWISS